MSYFNCLKEIIITNSYGIVAFTKKNNQYYYLMIQRNNTFGYIDIIKGKYEQGNHMMMKNLINNMTTDEKKSIQTESFKTLWNTMWTKNVKICKESQEIFEKNYHDIVFLINESTNKWDEPEWEFPKGRKNITETELSCAIREFTEETGIDRSEINIIENIFPYEEYNIGTNFKPYRFKYYLAYILDPDIDISHYQDAEVRNLKWFTYDECLKKIRDYHYGKKQNLDKINNLINLI